MMSWWFMIFLSRTKKRIGLNESYFDIRYLGQLRFLHFFRIGDVILDKQMGAFSDDCILAHGD